MRGPVLLSRDAGKAWLELTPGVPVQPQVLPRAGLKNVSIEDHGSEYLAILSRTKIWHYRAPHGNAVATCGNKVAVKNCGCSCVITPSSRKSRARVEPLHLLISATAAYTPRCSDAYRYRRELVRSDDGVWRRRAKSGALTRVTVIPRSLALWLRALREPS